MRSWVNEFDGNQRNGARQSQGSDLSRRIHKLTHLAAAVSVITHTGAPAANSRSGQGVVTAAVHGAGGIMRSGKASMALAAGHRIDIKDASTDRRAGERQNAGQDNPCDQARPEGVTML